MAGNPIPYNQLFDIDGLKAAIKDAEQASDEFGASVTQDFQRSQAAATALRKELEGINAVMGGKTIRLTDESGQQQIVQYAQEVARLSTQIKNQQLTIDKLTASINQNKQVISDAKAMQAQYAAELAKGKVEQQQSRIEIANTTLELKKLALANREATQAAKERNAITTQYSDSNAEVQAYAASINNSGSNTASSGQVALLEQFNADLQSGKITAAEYETALAAMAEQQEFFAQQTAKASVTVEEEVGILTGLRTTLAELKAENLTIIDPEMLAKSNARIQELEAEITRMSNVGKVGFDNMGNAVVQTVEKTGKFEGAIARATSLSNIGARAVTMLTRQIIGLGVGMLSFVVGAKAIEFITKWIENLRIFNPLADEATLKIKDMNAALASSDYTKAIDNIQTLTEDIKLAKEGFLDKTEVLKEYNDKLGATLGYTNDLDKAEQLMVQHGDAYLQMMLLKSAAQIALGEAAKKAYEAQQIANTPTDQFGNLVSFGAGNSSAPGAVPGEDAITLMKRRQAAEKANKEQQIADANDLKDKQLKIFKDFREQAAKIAKENHIDFFDGKDHSKGIDDAQLTSIEQIKERIAELSKLPGSAKVGNPIEKRIEVLKVRLKELTKSAKTAKDGFAALEEQANKVLLLLQDSIIKDYADNQGKQTARTLELAAAYEKLVANINKYKQAVEDAILEDDKRNNIKNFGSVYPRSANADKPGLSQRDQNQIKVASNNDVINHNEIQLNDTVDKYNKENEAIIQLYEQRVITKEELDDRLTASERLQASDEYQINLDTINKQLDNAKIAYGEDSKQYSELLKQKSNLTKAFYDGNFHYLENELEKERKKIDEQYNETFQSLDKNAGVVGSVTGNSGLSNLFSDANNSLKKVFLSKQTGEDPLSNSDKFKMVAQAAMDATQTYTEYAINASRQRQAAIEQEMQYEIEGAGNNSEARQRIEEEYTKQILAEKQKQAKYAKAEAAMQVILNTAIGISSAASAIVTIPLIPFIAGLGAVELGLVLAQPLPQFAKGREDGPATFAELNERGPEALVKGNRIRFANKGKRGIGYLEKGEKVITADKTAEMINRQIAYQNESAENISQSRMIYDRYIATTTGNNNIDYERIGHAMTEAVSKMPFDQNILDERGFNRYLVTKNARIKSVRDRNRL